MKSEKNADQNSRSGDGSVSATPSTALLNRKLGTSPAPRMLTKSEIDLLRQSAREIAQSTREILANKKNKSKL